jgi:hypothetical protein
MFHHKPEGDKEKYSTIFRKSGNMTRLSSKRRKRHDAQILTTKYCAKSIGELESGEEIRLNPIMKDLIINGYEDGYNTQTGRKKRKKQQKEEAKAGTVKSVEENQPSWLDTLKEEIENLK